MAGITVIYIAGYGRSGSTVLDIALGASGFAVSAGELGYLPVAVRRGRMGCSCGSPYQDCDVWKRAAETVMSRQRREWLHARNLLAESVVGVPALAARDGYSTLWKSVVEGRLLNADSNVLVDSSKTAYRFAKRPEALARCSGVNVYVIHVKRSLKDVLKSREKGKNTDVARDRQRLRSRLLWRTRTTVGWWLANRMAERLQRNKWIAGWYGIDYARFAEDPKRVVKDVTEYVRARSGDDSGDSVEIPDNMPVFHVVEGNRLVRAGSVPLIRPK